MVCVALLGAALMMLPAIVVDHDLGRRPITSSDRLSAINSVRATLLQLTAGIVLFFGAYATWRQLRVSQDTLRITQEGHITGQFSRAIDHLGNDKQDVRIGGLHALRRLAEHSERDREAVISTMAAFLRAHQPWPPTAPPADADINTVAPLETRAPDSQLALTCLGVLGRFDRSDPWLNLSLTDLRRADFDGLWLTRMNFDRACLESASLFAANLTRASLVSVNLRHASLRRANLTEARGVLADLRGALVVESVLTGADFTRADLREANLRKARAQATVFRDADLRDADLRGADLSDADLSGARLDGALASDRTRWPAAFDHAAAGIVTKADPGPEPSPLLQPPALLDQAPRLRSGGTP
ncbi:pentapeptide repeat-containing protein [Actinoplanes sp. NPDC051851]|uniref:pentapeptide repeat-containing protein n=1 Tax=Actinoplanes sp. NPDC051851 TaxID=3154753 RepID=UPI00344AB687